MTSARSEAAANISARLAVDRSPWRSTSAPCVDQRLDRVGVARRGGEHQRRRAVASSRALTSAPAATQRLDHRGVAALAREEQRRVAADARRRAARSRRHRAASSPARRRPSCAAQCSAVMPSPCARVDVGAVLQQRAHGVAVALHRRVGDRRRGAARAQQRRHASDSGAAPRLVRRSSSRIGRMRSAARPTSHALRRIGRPVADALFRSSSPVLSPKLLHVVAARACAAPSASRWPSACRRRP